jgi:hypothetical protein
MPLSKKSWTTFYGLERIGEYKAAYTDAKLIAPQATVVKKEKDRLVFDGGA